MKSKIAKKKITGKDKKVKETIPIRSDLKAFIEKFKSDIEKKRKAYELFAKKSQRKTVK